MFAAVFRGRRRVDENVASLAVVVLLLVGLVGVVAAALPEEVGLPAEARVRLEQYVAHALPSGGASVKWLRRARMPWNFDQEMSTAVYGSGAQFETDQGFPAALPLPYPPRELWCVLLEEDGGWIGGPNEGVHGRIVFVGLHMSLYEADWLVHEGATQRFTPRLMEALLALGCERGLGDLRE